MVLSDILINIVIIKLTVKFLNKFNNIGRIASIFEHNLSSHSFAMFIKILKYMSISFSSVHFSKFSIIKGKNPSSKLFNSTCFSEIIPRILARKFLM